jgi:hypothetical protein
MRQFWLALGLALALPTVSPIFWPFGLGLIFLTRPALAQCALVVLLLMRLPVGLAVLQGWWENGWARVSSPIGVYPQLIAADHPQLLTLYAPRSSSLKAHWQGNQLPMQAEALGHGLFRLRVSGAQARPGSALEVETDGDGGRQLALHWLPVKARPGAMCGYPERGLAAAVSESSDEVLLLNREAKVWRIACGDGPTCCQFLPGGRLLAVGTNYAQDLEVLDLARGRMVARWPLGDPAEAICLSEDGHWLALLAGRRVQFRILPDLQLEGEVQLPEAGELAVFAGSSLVVASRRGRALYRIDHGAGWSLYGRPRPLARPALGLALGSHSGDVWLASTSAQLNGGHQKGNHFVLNCLLRLDVPAWELHAPVSTELRNAQQGGPGSVSSGGGPEGLARSGDGQVLLVYSGTQEVAAHNPVTGEEKRYSLAPAGLLAPRFIADLGAETWAVSLPAQHTLAWVRGGEVTHKIQLDSIDLADQGEIGFYESTLSGISCQSCHTRGDSDYARHDIGGFQAWGTLSCQGIQGTPPYLRNGSYARMEDLHEVALGLYRNYGRVALADRRQALRAYLDRLLLPENPHPAPLAELKSGCQTFFDSGCANCHEPPRFTNCASLPNQNLFPGQLEFEWLDVPSLHGVWRSAPYLHDQRAAQLSDLWERQNQADRHGSTRALSAAQRRDLESFLQCL